MNARELLEAGREAGFTFSLGEGGKLIIKPGSKLTELDRMCIAEMKQGILELLMLEQQQLEDEAIDAAVAVIEERIGPAPVRETHTYF